MGSNVTTCRALRQLLPVSGDCLLLIDVQNDFLPGGKLPVPQSGRMIGPLNEYITAFTALSLPIFISRDWHPADHCSFQSFGGRWPVHCVAGTSGANFPRELSLPDDVRVVSKAVSSERESYSDFDGTGLADYMRHYGVHRLFIGGLATEYCVLATVEDALRKRFDVVLLLDAIRAINLNPSDGDFAVQRMIRAGAMSASWRNWPDGTRRITFAD